MVGNIKIYSLGCRLNTLEAEKIRRMLTEAGAGPSAVINTCAVTNEALRQSRQQFHKIIRENPGISIFITGCGATMKPEEFAGATIIPNKDKFNPVSYGLPRVSPTPPVVSYEKMQKKGFVQIGDGCDRHCTYCITRVLRGKAAHFPADQILVAAKALLDNGYEEIILTGVNIADYYPSLTDLCRNLLVELPGMKFLTLSSLDPAADVEGVIDLIRENPRMTKHVHLSVQSGSDTILQKMARRHTAERIREVTNYANNDITFSWDIICGFPGENEELFNETLELARELNPIKIHAFPFSARPGTPAAEMPDKITRKEAKDRVKKIIRLQ